MERKRVKENYKRLRELGVDWRDARQMRYFTEQHIDLIESYANSH